MAKVFNRSKLSRIGGNGSGSTTWQYRTTGHTSTVVSDINYFGAMADKIKEGDILIITGTMGSTPTGRISEVVSNDGSVITWTKGSVITP
tara:strand:+ start:361 stop:630 length:270 start_codon:yes stop_codon:yes gene_type:complete